jgi:F0F1-type ATP synthase assembly protein I
MNSIFDEKPAAPEEPRKEAFTTLGLGDGGEHPGSRRDYAPPAVPESLAETVRMSGMAYSAAMTLVASIVFMMLIGWFVDLIAGTAPYGVVGGIIVGATMGFFQFFRITSRIFRK